MTLYGCQISSCRICSQARGSWQKIPAALVCAQLLGLRNAISSECMAKSFQGQHIDKAQLLKKAQVILQGEQSWKTSEIYRGNTLYL